MITYIVLFEVGVQSSQRPLFYCLGHKIDEGDVHKYGMACSEAEDELYSDQCFHQANYPSKPNGKYL